MSTGEIELHVTDVKILNRSKVPPFLPGQQELSNEDLRLKHRYLDLRRPEMQATMNLRSQITKAIRDYFEVNGFIDIETPILGRRRQKVPAIILFRVVFRTEHFTHCPNRRRFTNSS